MSEKNKNKKPFKTEDIDNSKMLVSKKASHGKESIKYYLGYNDDDDVTRPLCIKFPQMVGYVKHSKSNNRKDTITMLPTGSY